MSRTFNEWNLVKHFHSFEFDSKDAPGSGELMNLDFVRKLDKLRDLVGQPLTILSGYRTEAHNATVGGVDGSAHTSGHAADIAALGSSMKFAILKAAFTLGFRRIGVGASFVHIDDDPTKVSDVVWTYPATDKRG